MTHKWTGTLTRIRDHYVWMTGCHCRGLWQETNSTSVFFTTWHFLWMEKSSVSHYLPYRAAGCLSRLCKWDIVGKKAERWPPSGRGRRFCHWRGQDAMPHAAKSSPGRLSAARRSRGRGCLLTACATRTLPKKKKQKKKWFNWGKHHKRQNKCH